MRYLLLLIAAFLLPALPGRAQQIPHMDLTTLSRGHIVLPVPGSTKPLIVLVTFSHKGSSDDTAWNKAVGIRYETDPHVDYIELADFQGVPQFLMHFILHGMRRQIKEPEKSHFAPFFTHDATWKKLAHFGNPDITYVLVATPSGRVVWQTQGPVDKAKAAALQSEIQKLLAPSH
jgi:hypothetical protein